MSTHRIDIQSEGWGELLMDPDATGLWEYLRRVGKPASAIELAEMASLPLALVQSKLDMLVARGIAEVIPATARRRNIGYRVLMDALVVECDFARDRELMQRLADARQRHLEEVRGEGPFAKGPPVPGEWRALFACTLPLTADEVAELRRRLGSVVEFTELLAAKYSAPANEPPALSNYAVGFRVDPVAKPCLPQPRIVFVRKGAPEGAGERPIADAQGPKLSRREWDVALALSRGLTQAEAGHSLGISPLTAVTLTKRIYKKLGVRRRAELVSRLQQVVRPPGQA
jgi:DNA-binding CsgD family transcriptional regulator